MNTTVHQTSCRCSSRRDSGGNVLVVLLVAIMGVTAAIITAADASDRSQQHVNSDVEQSYLTNTAESVITMTAETLWKGFLQAQNGNPVTLTAARAYLDGRGITITPPPPAGGFAGTGSTSGHQLLAMGMPQEMGFPTTDEGTPTWSGLHVLELQVERQDVTGSVILTFTSTVASTTMDDPARRWTSRQSFSIGSPPFKGLGFALLSNNVNCIMCHANITTTDLFYNRDPSLYGTFEGTKVGALESLLIRANSAQSSVAGLFYTRGQIMNMTGTILPNLNGTTLMGYALDANGNVVQNQNGNMTPVPLQVIDESGVTGANAVLPETFPSVIPDANGNKIVDQAEFDAMVGNSFGSISGGVQVSVAPGATYNGSGMPSTSNTGGTISGSHSGNLVLYGTEQNPIELNGTVAVDGDVVIAGYVKGKGELVARGNVYVVGPIKYADGTTVDPTNGATYRTFGIGPDGRTNQLAIGAGGNILVGDYMSKKDLLGQPITGLDTGGYNFTMSETTLFNRMEWTKTQPTLPGINGTVVANPLYQPGYVPRYYTISDGDPVYLYVGSEVYFDPNTKTWLGREHLRGWEPGKYMTIDPSDPAYASAVIKPLGPANDWLSTSKLYSLWNDMGNKFGGNALDIDSMLYTNNSIMSIAVRVSPWGGRMNLNGGIVAADTGILVPGPVGPGVGLQLNYDKRLANAFKLRDDNALMLFRLLSH